MKLLEKGLSMKQTIPCKCDGADCTAVINVRPLIEGVENPIPLVELEIDGGKCVFLDEQGVIDLYIKARNALNLQPVPDEVAAAYDYE